MKRLLAVALLVLAGWGFAQTFSAGARITNCVGIGSGGLDASIFCNLTGFIETPGVGLFAQVSPKYGPAWDNFQVRAYRPLVRWDAFGVALRSQPGVTVARELGEWVFRVEVDTLFTVEW